MTVQKGCNFQEQSIPFESLQPFIDGRVNSERVATFWNFFLLPINKTHSLEFLLMKFSWFLFLLLHKNLFVYFTVVEWFVDTRVFGICTLVIEIILFLEYIFQIEPRILEGNNFLKGTLCTQVAWSFCVQMFLDCGTLQIKVFLN